MPAVVISRATDRAADSFRHRSGRSRGSRPAPPGPATPRCGGLPRLGLALVALAAVACADPAPRPRPGPGGDGEAPRNLLLLTLDTTRADSLGAYGGDPGITPHLDALAAAGARFEQAIAPLALTRPSHATMLTGLTPHAHGVWSNGPYRLEPAYPTLVGSFRRAGFRTAAVVASFVLSRSFGFAEGFELYDDAMPPDSAAAERGADAVVDAAIGWLAGVQPEERFLLWVHLYDPHTPYAPPEPWATRFADRPYLGEVAFMDHQIGRLLSHLGGRGMADGTLVVAVADHGESLGAHSEDTHGYFLYDDTVRVPLVLRGPGVPPGAVVDAQVTLADLAPTLLEAFGLALEGARFDGVSFWRELRDGQVTERPALVENRAIRHQYGWAPLAGLRAEGWKWIRAPIPELYDLADDPGESRNLAAARARTAQRLERLRLELLPPEPAAAPQTALSPEAEERLRALGYVTAPAPAGPPDDAGPDPKTVAAAIPHIEALTELRQTAGAGDPAGREAELLAAILRADPTNLFALRLEGQRLVAAGRFREAIEVLAGIVEGHETHPEALAYLAMAYQGAGRSGDAAAWFIRATEPPWIYWPGVESLARLSVAHPAEVPRDWLVARLDRLQPVSPRERLSVARAFAILSEHARAERRFESALDAGTEALVGLAQMQAAQGRTADALATLAAVRPPTVESRFVTGATLWQAGERGRACSEFRLAMGLEPRNVNLLLGLGRHLEACGEAALAADAYRLVLAREPRHPGALQALQQLGAPR